MFGAVCDAEFIEHLRHAFRAMFVWDIVIFQRQLDVFLD